MEPLGVQNNNIVSNIPNEAIEKTRKTESTEADKRKTDKDFSSYTDEMRTISVSDINGEDSSEITKISLAGAQVECLKKRLLVLDINGLLAHVDSRRRQACKKRPFYLEFLEFCFEKFEVGVWSSRSKENVERVLNKLMVGDMKSKLLFCWDGSHCTETRSKSLECGYKTLMFKDLRKIWEKSDPNLPWEKGYYNESNTLLLDDSPYKALLNPPYTSVFPHSFSSKNLNDNSLGVGGDLREYLDKLADAENIPKYVKEHPFGQEAIGETDPSWNFYREVLASLSACKTEGNVTGNFNNNVHPAY